MTFRITDEALADLGEIREFIENQMQNSQGAEIVENYLFEAFERIARSPRACGGRLRPDITTKPVKFLTVRRYMVIYDDRSEPVVIVAVAGVRQDLGQLLTSDRRFAADQDE